MAVLALPGRSAARPVRDAAAYPDGRGHSFVESDVDDASLLRRCGRALYGSQPARRVVPWPAAKAAVRAQAALLWRSERVRAAAHQEMAFLLGASERAGDVEQLARRHVLVQHLLTERLWRPWLTTARPVLDVHNVFDAVAARRGVILSIMHHGDYNAIVPPLRMCGIEHVHAPASPVHFFGKHKIGPRQGVRTASWRGGISLFNAVGSFPHMCELLSAGEICSVAWDLPGSTEVSFLGRRVQVASGTARLARATGALVVPLSVEGDVDGDHQPLRALAPIDVADFDTPVALMQAVADAHEPAVLAWPEGLVQPRVRWRASEVDER